MKFNTITWPLKAVLLISAIVFASSSAKALFFLPTMSILANLAPTYLDGVIIFLPFFALLLLVVLSSFTFARVLYRQSHLAAQIYLLIIFGLSSVALFILREELTKQDSWIFLWLAFIVFVFFKVRPRSDIQGTLKNSAV